jgi:hypothetical protein
MLSLDFDPQFMPFFNGAGMKNNQPAPFFSIIPNLTHNKK